MGRGTPELPETGDEVRRVLSDQEFFVPRAELPAEPDERKAYVRRLHVLHARTLRRFEHSRLVLADERATGSEPELPESVAEARDELDETSFFIPAARLPDDADQLGEYIEHVHLRLARAVEAFRHNQEVIHQRRALGEAGDTSGTAATLTDDPFEGGAPVDGRIDESPARSAGDGPVTDETDTSSDPESESPETGANESDDAADEGPTDQPLSEEADKESTADASPSDGASDETAGESSEGRDSTDEGASEGDDEAGGFVFGRPDDTDTGEATAEGDASEFGAEDPDTDEESVQSASTEQESTGAVAGDGGAKRTQMGGASAAATAGEHPDKDGRLSRRQLIIGGSVAGVLTIGVGGGLAAFLLGDDGNDESNAGNGTSDDESTGGENGGDDDGSTPPGGNGGQNGGENGTENGGENSTENGGENGTENGTANGGENVIESGEGGEFELVDFQVTTEPDNEYVELASAESNARDISGYILYDEGGRADPTEPNTLDPFTFPEGTVLSPGESVRVYTGSGQGGDGVFYWDYGLNIWNQSGDTVILEDTTGSVVFEREYGPQE